MTVAAAALAVAAGAHFAALPDHVDQGAAVSAFFAVTASLQLLAAVMVGRGAHGRLRVVVAAGNIGVIAMWLWSRTFGIPLGGNDGGPEAVGLVDVVAVIAAVVACAGLWIPVATRHRRRSWAGAIALIAIALLVVGTEARFAPESHAHVPAETPTGGLEHRSDGHAH